MTDALLYDPLDPAVQADPFPTYERLRSQDPVHRSPLGFWVISRHDDCHAMLRDPQTSVDYRHANPSPLAGPALDEITSLKDLETFLFLDPPEHTRLRAAFAPALTAEAVARYEAEADMATAAVVDRLAQGDRLDVIEALAYPLPIDIVCLMLGVAGDDRTSMRGWSRALARGMDPDVTQTPETLAAGHDAIVEMVAFFGDELRRRRSRGPRPAASDGLLDHLVAEHDLSDAEIARNAIVLLIAGHETSANLIGNGLVALLSPLGDEARAQVARGDDPQLVVRCIEELLRFDSPVQVTKRIPTTDLVVGGTTIPKGDMVVILLGAANRDPDVFDNPAGLVLDRESNQHLAFGGGPHYCLGARLARLEGQTVLRGLSAILPRLEMDGAAPVKEGIVIRGRTALPVRAR